MQTQVAHILQKMDSFSLYSKLKSIAHSQLYRVDTIMCTVYDIIFRKSNFPFSLGSVAPFSLFLRWKGWNIMTIPSKKARTVFLRSLLGGEWTTCNMHVV